MPTAAQSLPSRIPVGCVIKTLIACRAYRAAERPDPRKQARKCRMEAEAFDRAAGFALDDHKPALAAQHRAESARLRTLADSFLSQNHFNC